jgi:hypothetical protein
MAHEGALSSVPGDAPSLPRPANIKRTSVLDINDIDVLSFGDVEANGQEPGPLEEKEEHKNQHISNPTSVAHQNEQNPLQETITHSHVVVADQPLNEAKEADHKNGIITVDASSVEHVDSTDHSESQDATETDIADVLDNVSILIYLDDLLINPYCCLLILMLNNSSWMNKFYLRKILPLVILKIL